MSPTADQPRRQSCDRCHLLKVRCIRQPGPDSSPCVRCDKAGACCVYSLQQRVGRPPSADSRKRPRVSTTASTTTASTTTTSTTTSSTLSTRSSTPPPPPAPVTAAAAQPSPAALSSVNIDVFAEDWFGDLASLPNLSPFDPPGLTTHPAETLNLGIDSVESYISELSDLNLRLYQSARTISPSTIEPLSVSSPAVNDIFDATRSLIHLLGRMSAAGSTVGNAPTDYFNQLPRLDLFSAGVSVQAPAPSPPDTGVVLMVLACHQRLLGAFENMCNSLNQQLCAVHPLPFMNLNQTQVNAGHFTSTSEASTSMTCPPTQAVLIIELISHLLSRLDRALSLLGYCTDGRIAATGNPLPSSSSASSSSSSTSNSAPPSPVLEPSLDNASARGACRIGNGTRPNRCSEVAEAVVNSMQSRHNRLRTHMKLIKRHTKRSSFI
ncbi:uncharacterized protein K452DRAFT_292305 [Aplosporella prunicola CBS 121167]|uniref:Zn(2)-C6 fungal-type domain-containing protein n=1 Tax=Aplosporella prunicola CBS 121167 TaxID=1176127 RepID=A0A6A6B1B9_9PEZI|nr:uncharacterized protein K452DRAFT_292305 [Aplosporella prunicola CBS 121167]KAF2136531.1 hypothetical protein K452DRAFT_292305 [Aplosporella prunicola CBS 121167]